MPNIESQYRARIEEAGMTANLGRPMPPRPRGFGGFSPPLDRWCISTFSDESSFPKAVDILKTAGYDDLSQTSSDMQARVETAISLAAIMVVPNAHFRCVAIDRCAHRNLSLETGSLLHWDAFPKVLSRCRYVIVFAATLGKGIDDLEERLIQRERFFECALIQSFGHLALKNFIVALTDHIRAKIIDRGFDLTSSIQPGDAAFLKGRKAAWRLEDRKVLLRVLANSCLPVGVLGTDALTPRLTQIGLFGVRRAENATTGNTVRRSIGH